MPDDTRIDVSSPDLVERLRADPYWPIGYLYRPVSGAYRSPTRPAPGRSSKCASTLTGAARSSA